MKNYDAVFFISFGGPEKKEDIMPFLEIVTQGRNIPRARLEDVAHHYETIGGASPINAITRRQAQALRAEIGGSQYPLPVYVGQRNWHPFLEEALQQMAKDGIKKVLGFPTAAHRCEASLERYVKAVEAARQKVGPSAPEVDFVGPWFDHPLFIEAIAERIREVLRPMPVERQAATRWYFTAHSIPCEMAKTSTYVQELQRTAELIGNKFDRQDWGLAYSSRSGNPRDPWLEPDVCDVLRAEAQRGTKDVLFIPIGFVADHVEILFDLDIEAQAAAKEVGVTLWRAPSVGDHPLFVRMIANVLYERSVQGDHPAQRDSRQSMFRDGRRPVQVGSSSPICYCQPGSATPRCLKTAVPKSL